LCFHRTQSFETTSPVCRDQNRCCRNRFVTSKRYTKPDDSIEISKKSVRDGISQTFRYAFYFVYQAFAESLLATGRHGVIGVIESPMPRVCELIIHGNLRRGILGLHALVDLLDFRILRF
jgi:hypothetical protein